MVIIALLTGHIKDFCLFMSIILFHELGHILLGIFFKWKIEKIIVLPFGGLTIFQEYINRPIWEEFLVCIAGPVFQIVYYLFISKFIDITYIHYSLLIFNLLPIIPLDGSKIFNLLLNKLLPFHLSHIMTTIISFNLIFGIILWIICLKWDLLLFLTICLLMIKTIEQLKSTNYIFNRFILERYIKEINIKKIKKIKGLNLKKMYRDYKHIFVVNKNYYTEREIIKKRFDLQGKVW